MLTMSRAAQCIFMQRVLFIFEVSKRSAGKAQSLKLTTAQWMAEADMSCFACYIMETMRTHRDDANQVVFGTPVLEILVKNFVDGRLGCCGMF